MDQSITFDLGAIEASIGQITKNIDDMVAIQESINSFLNNFGETWTTSKSPEVFEKLEAFVSNKAPSNLTNMLNELYATLDRLEKMFKHVEEIDNIGAH